MWKNYVDICSVIGWHKPYTFVTKWIDWKLIYSSFLYIWTRTKWSTYIFYSSLYWYDASICEWIQLRNMLIGNHIDEQIHPYLETCSHWRRHRGNALRNEQKNSNDISILECWFYAWILMTNSPMVHHNNSIRWGQRHCRLLPFISHCKWWRKNRKVKISVNFFVFLKTRLQTHSMKHLN